MNINEILNYKDGDHVEGLTGWVDSIRDHGGLTFVDLRDFTGTVQVVFDKSGEIDIRLKNEYYICVDGNFKKRDDSLVNKKVFLGDSEIEVTNLSVINPSKTLPFQIENDIDTDENIRLKYISYFIGV